MLSTPLLASLAAAYPNTQIDYLVTEGCQEVLARNDRVRKVFTLAKKRGFFSHIFGKLALLFKLPRYDLVFNLSSSKFGVTIGILTRAKITSFATKSRLHNRFVSRLVKRDWDSKHVVLQGLDLLLPTQPRLSKCEFWVKTEAKNLPLHKNLPNQTQVKCEFIQAFREKFLVDLPPKFILFCVTASNIAKSPGVEFFANLANFVEGLGFAVVVSGAANECEEVEKFCQRCNTSPLNLCGKTSLEELAFLGFCAQFYIGNDTATQHICAAVGTRCVGIFADTPIYNWGAWDEKSYPLNDRSLVLGAHAALKIALQNQRNDGLFPNCSKQELDALEAEAKKTILLFCQNQI